MEKSVIAEGSTTNEAIENGLKQLKVSRDMVEIKVLDNPDKRSFFSILTPRVVKVELKLKEKLENTSKIDYKKPVKDYVLSVEEQEKVKSNLTTFLDVFLPQVSKDVDYEIKTSEKETFVNIKNKNLGFLIGYRGETLYAMQNILSAVSAKGLENRPRIILDIGDYKEKREKTLEDLADKIARTVIKNKKSITLEPMQAYERKIIHTKLQDNNKIETKSIGEEPRRRIVISLKKL